MIVAKIIKKIPKCFGEGKPTGKHLHSTKVAVKTCLNLESRLENWQESYVLFMFCFAGSHMVV